jgi:hypothetical protein
MITRMNLSAEKWLDNRVNWTSIVLLYVGETCDVGVAEVPFRIDLAG